MSKIISGKELYELIKSDNKAELERVVSHITHTLKLYLESVHKAPQDVAENVANDIFIKIYSMISKNELSDTENIYGYMITSAKNEYFMYLRKHANKSMPIRDELHTKVGEDDVLQELHDEERKKVLMKCIDKLNKNNRKLIFSILRYIDYADIDTAKELGIEYGRFRTQKFRLIHILHECVQKYYPDE